MSDWAIDELDLDAYLRRIGVTEPTLNAIHAAHMATIPFENIDVLLDRVPALDLPSIQAKFARRGGYCYEHNLVYAAALERLGFTVQRLLARPGATRHPMRAKTHMLLLVEADGEQLLTDVGYGGGNLLEPMPLREGTMRQGAWTFRLVRDDEQWVLQSLIADEWRRLYGFTLERKYPVDYTMANFYTATAPGSPFKGRLLAQTTDAEARHALDGNELTTAKPDGTTEKRTLTTEEIFDQLAAFGIGLTDAEHTHLSATL